MDVFLNEHGNYVKWIAVTMVVGLAVTAVWASRFRLLRRTDITPAQLRAESWRGVLGGVAWLVLLSCILIILSTSFEIIAFEALANSDNLSPWLVESITQARTSIWPPALAMYGVALTAMVAAGMWSGSLTVLLKRGRSHG